MTIRAKLGLLSIWIFIGFTLPALGEGHRAPLLLVNEIDENYFSSERTCDPDNDLKLIKVTEESGDIELDDMVIVSKPDQIVITTPSKNSKKYRWVKKEVQGLLNWSMNQIVDKATSYYLEPVLTYSLATGLAFVVKGLAAQQCSVLIIPQSIVTAFAPNLSKYLLKRMTTSALPLVSPYPLSN